MDILKAWNIVKDLHYEVIVTRDNEPSVWLVDNRLYLKRLDDIGIITDLYTMCVHLSEHGIPVSVPFLTTQCLPYAQDGTAAYFLRTRLEGDTLNDFWSIDWPEMSFNVGVETAKLHIALLSCPELIHAPRKNMLDTVMKESLSIIHTHKVIDELCLSDDVIAQYLAKLAMLYPQLPRQLIHYDLHGNNLLFKDGELCGIIDLDTCAYEIRLFEPLYFAGWLLWRMESQNDTWVNLVLHILRGYNSVMQMTPQELDAVPAMLLCNQLFSTATRLRGNDESGINRSKAMLQHIFMNLNVIDEKISNWKS